MLQMQALYASIYFNPPSYYLTPQYTLILLHTMLTNPSTICLMPYALLPKPYASCQLPYALLTKPYASCLAYQANLWQCDAGRHPLLLHTNTMPCLLSLPPYALRLIPLAVRCRPSSFCICTQLLRCQDLYFCTSKASKFGTWNSKSHVST